MLYLFWITKTGVERFFLLFFKIDQCLDTSFKRCRQELSIDLAEDISILKNKGVVRIFVIFSR